ncbi:hypothetical protein DFH07DRAFT_756425 [Mycena maculata]|uniref:Uncharacterized protein n=1 Tax=Mycena maculata TaxID=230809 RepID=A0AAD7HX27_9AGAR|nr:hypothetical protein DFH07DRAFT_756425 [Mycena maculata]
MFDCSLVFRWVFIPWLQKELDSCRDWVNNTAKRADRNKVLPHGVPTDMSEHPGDYGVLDFKIEVEKEAVDSVHALYGPKDHEIFQLVPPDFQAIITEMYVQLGQPPVTRESCRDIYLQLLGQFRNLDSVDNIPQNSEKD